MYKKSFEKKKRRVLRTPSGLSLQPDASKFAHAAGELQIHYELRVQLVSNSQFAFIKNHIL